MGYLPKVGNARNTSAAEDMFMCPPGEVLTGFTQNVGSRLESISGFECVNPISGVRGTHPKKMGDDGGTAVSFDCNGQPIKGYHFFGYNLNNDFENNDIWAIVPKCGTFKKQHADSNMHNAKNSIIQTTRRSNSDKNSTNNLHNAGFLCGYDYMNGMKIGKWGGDIDWIQPHCSMPNEEFRKMSDILKFPGYIERSLACETGVPHQIGRNHRVDGYNSFKMFITYDGGTDNDRGPYVWSFRNKIPQHKLITSTLPDVDEDYFVVHVPVNDTRASVKELENATVGVLISDFDGKFLSVKSDNKLDLVSTASGASRFDFVKVGDVIRGEWATTGIKQYNTTKWLNTVRSEMSTVESFETMTRIYDTTLTSANCRTFKDTLGGNTVESARTLETFDEYCDPSQFVNGYDDRIMTCKQVCDTHQSMRESKRGICDSVYEDFCKDVIENDRHLKRGKTYEPGKDDTGLTDEGRQCACFLPKYDGANVLSALNETLTKVNPKLVEMVSDVPASCRIEECKSRSIGYRTLAEDQQHSNECKRDIINCINTITAEGGAIYMDNTKIKNKCGYDLGSDPGSSPDPGSDPGSSPVPVPDSDSNFGYDESYVNYLISKDGIRPDSLKTIDYIIIGLFVLLCVSSILGVFVVI